MPQPAHAGEPALGKRFIALLRSVLGQDLAQREAVIDGAVSIMEIPGLSDKVAKLHSFETPRRPVNLGDRASPCLRRESRGEGFTERAVEAGIVGNDEIGGVDKSPHLRDIDHLTGITDGRHGGRPGHSLLEGPSLDADRALYLVDTVNRTISYAIPLFHPHGLDKDCLKRLNQSID